MVVRAYAVCIGVTLECRQMESEMIGDGREHADEAYHDNSIYYTEPHTCLPGPLHLTLENLLGNALHQSQHPLQHLYSIRPSDITIHTLSI